MRCHLVCLLSTCYIVLVSFNVTVDIFAYGLLKRSSVVLGRRLAFLQRTFLGAGNDVMVEYGGGSAIGPAGADPRCSLPVGWIERGRRSLDPLWLPGPSVA